MWLLFGQQNPYIDNLFSERQCLGFETGDRLVEWIGKLCPLHHQVRFQRMIKEDLITFLCNVEELPQKKSCCKLCRSLSKSCVMMHGHHHEVVKIRLVPTGLVGFFMRL